MDLLTLQVHMQTLLLHLTDEFSTRLVLRDMLKIGQPCNSNSDTTRAVQGCIKRDPDGYLDEFRQQVSAGGRGDILSTAI